METLRIIWEFIVNHYGIFLAVVIVLLDAVTIYRIIRDTHSPEKTLAYLLLVIILPVVGAVFYFSFGINYRKERLYSKKVIADDNLFRRVEERIMSGSLQILMDNAERLKDVDDMVQLLLNDSKCMLSYNKAELLINGEAKFPAVFEALEKAEHFIHLEYYIVEEGVVADRFFEILTRKAAGGVKVRFIYDDFGSSGLKRKRLNALRAAGIEIYPFYEIKIYALANRLNYRDHRKIIIIDGHTAFLGGINFSDRYTNVPPGTLYWRDTHLKLTGASVNNLQYHFIANWNFCSGYKLEVDRSLFPGNLLDKVGEDLVQIVAGGPDYPRSSIMLSYFTAIVMAKKRIYITSPYFIPNTSIFDALVKAALSGKDVRLLLPGISDSRIVNAAAKSYFSELLKSGVRIFLYRKGFVHAKTMLVDDTLSMVGTANMDVRSFDLNFEINAVVYSSRINSELHKAFLSDLENSEEVDPVEWGKRGKMAEFGDACARLLSPLL
ncbi:MAG: cardiolipin synthase [Chitinophagaceae bacterium]|nr:cardiolipin synthase [Chitinophagaceae bacterium]MCW5926116.1 cardiolipin synthase [Chitinophagaceae bacterium]